MFQSKFYGLVFDILWYSRAVLTFHNSFIYCSILVWLIKGFAFFFYNIWNLWNFILSSLAGSTICIIDMRALYLFLLIIVLAHSPWYKILVPWYLLKLLTEQVHGKLVVLSDFWFLLMLFQSTYHPYKHWLAYWLIHNIVCIFICMPYYLFNELLIKI